METSVDEQQMKDDNVPNAESVFIGAVNHCERGTIGTRRNKRRNVDQRAGKEETERALEGLQRETGPPRGCSAHYCSLSWREPLGGPGSNRKQARPDACPRARRAANGAGTEGTALPIFLLRNNSRK